MICSRQDWARAFMCQYYIHKEGEEMPACPGVAAFLKSEYSSSPSCIWCWRTLWSEVAGQNLFYPSRDGHGEHKMQSPALHPLSRRPLWRFYTVLAMWTGFISKPQNLFLFFRSLLESQQGAWHGTKKMERTHKSKLVQKLSNDGVTFVLRGEIRNRHSLTPVNIHPSDRRTRVASCKWNDFLPPLK